MYLQLDAGHGKHRRSGSDMQVLKLEDIRRPQNTFGDNHFQVFIDDMLFLIGQFLEFFKYQFQFFIRKVIA